MRKGHCADLTPRFKDAEELVAKARQCGVVLNIESIPDLPLATGNYHEVVSVRSAREFSIQKTRANPHKGKSSFSLKG